MTNRQIIEALNSLTALQKKAFAEYLDAHFIPYTRFTNGSCALSFTELTHRQIYSIKYFIRYHTQ